MDTQAAVNARRPAAGGFAGWHGLMLFRATGYETMDPNILCLVEEAAGPAIAAASTRWNGGAGSQA